jgi:phosphoglycerol transferase MdoB-like AlkP superfamily enzyme
MRPNGLLLVLVSYFSPISCTPSLQLDCLRFLRFHLSVQNSLVAVSINDRPMMTKKIRTINQSYCDSHYHVPYYNFLITIALSRTPYQLHASECELDIVTHPEGMS